ncbi:MAG: hypothetical protein LBV00_01760, partial [Propionibacteriaceae bacterium]|nr:hypothetical protein [Propionibacteriaceae bacterium]
MSQVGSIRRGLVVGLATVLAATLGLASLTSMPVASAAPADVVTSFTLTPQGDTTQLSGKELNFTWTITTNAAVDERLTEPVVKVTIPAGCVTNINPSSVGNVTPQVSLVNGNYEITWALADITGGQSYSVPLVANLSDGLCADQGKIPVTAVVSDRGDTTIKANNDTPLTFTTITGNPTVKGSTPDMSGRTDPPVALTYGGKSNDNGKTLSTDPNELTYVPFNYSSGWSTDPGGRDFASVVLRNDLPPGATFDPAKNPGWTLSADGKAVERTIPGTVKRTDMARLLEETHLYLKFPGATTGQPLTNTVTFTGTPVNPAPGEKPYTATHSSQFELAGAWAPTAVLQKYGIDSLFDAQTARENGASWVVELTNKATDAPMGFNVSDYSELATTKPANDVTGRDLDARMYFDSLTLRPPMSMADYSRRWSGPIEILTCQNNGAPSVVATVTVPAGTATLNVPLPNGPSITCVQVRGANGAMIDPEKILTWNVNAKFRDPSQSLLGGGQKQGMDNTAYADVTWSDGRPPLSGAGASFTGYVPVQKYQPEMQVVKDVSAINGGNPGTLEGAQVVVGNTVKWEVRPFIYHVVPGLTAMDSVTLIDLLPPGITYNPGSTKGWINTSSSTTATLGEPAVVDNYHGSGRQALIWTTPPIKDLTSTVVMVMDATFETTVTAEVTQGTNENWAYVLWEGGDGMVPNPQVTDKYDLNNNGSKQDQVAGDPANVVYTPPRALLTSKRVKGSYDTDFLAAPQIATTDITKRNVEYLMRYTNNSIQDVTRMTSIDALPTVGDTTLSPNSSGVLPPRDSQFPIRLTGPVQVPADRAGDFTVTYTTDSTAGRNASQVNAQVTWTTTPSDWAAVTAFRIQLNDGKILAQGQTVDFTVSAAVPNDPSVVGKTAFNSFATSLDNATTSFFESSLTGTTVVDRNPRLQTLKTVNPADGTTVLSGDAVAYTLKLDNSAGTAPAAINLTDDLSDTIDDATIQADSLSVAGNGVTAAWTADGKGLALTGSVAAGEVVTITYWVKVKDDGARGDNSVNNCLGPSCTKNPVENRVPRLVTSKSVTPTPGTSVLPGDTLTYTVTLDNTTGTAAAPIDLTDDVTGVVDDATVNLGSLNVSLPSVTGTWTADGKGLALTGSVPAGQKVIVTYQATVAPYGSHGDEKVVNCLPGVPCTENPIPPGIPALVVGKSVDPAAGTQVNPGDVVTYTLRLDNSKGTASAPVSLTDDVSGVLDDATIDQSSVVVTGGGAGSPGVTATWSGDGKALVLSGSVGLGQQVTVTYQATVKEYGSHGDMKVVNCLPGVPCTENPITPGTPRLTPLKSVAPASGTPVNPGDVVTYTLTLDNSKGTAPATVSSTDVTGDVSDDATIDQGSVVVSDPGVTYSWDASGNLVLGGTVGLGQQVTVTFKATVKDYGQLSAGMNVKNCFDAAPCTENPITPGTPQLRTVKAVDPASGTPVNPGDVVTYTLTFDNSRGTAPAPVDATDDVSDLTDDATIDQASLSITGSGLTASWGTDGNLVVKGSVGLGQQVTVSYKATVKPYGQLSAGLNAKNCLSGVPCTENPITPGTPRLTPLKSVSPASGVHVAPGDVVTYTLTLDNSKGTAPATVSSTDVTGDVSDDAVIDQGSVVVSDPGVTYSWDASGNLVLGGTVGLGQQVTVT